MGPTLLERLLEIFQQISFYRKKQEDKNGIYEMDFFQDAICNVSHLHKKVLSHAMVK